MEGAPQTPDTTPDAETTESKPDKKRDKQTAQSLGETLFKAETKPETTFWERLGIEKEKSDTEPQEEVVALREALDQDIAERQTAVQAELGHVDASTPEAAAIAADAALLEQSREQFGRMDSPEQAEAAIDTAYQQTSEAIDTAIYESQRPDEAAEAPVPNPGDAGGAGQPPGATPAAAEPPEGYRPPESSIAEPASNEGLAAAQASEVYRRGRNDGLFVGGVIGYLKGRRTGRKKAEKRLKPAFEKLENKLKQTSERLTRREQDIRRLAAEKVAAAPLTTRVETVTETLTPPVIPEHPITVAPPVETAVMPLPVQEIQSVPSSEADPAAAARELAVSRSEYAGILPFNTLSERLSQQELKTIAEKVKVDDVSLKDMYESRQFDEKGLRRIVDEFLRGGDVRRAVTTEVTRQDKAFELDPRMRHSTAAGALGGGGTAGTIDGQYRELPSKTPSQSPQDNTEPKRLPELGQAATEQLRRKQIVTVAGVTVVVIVAIVLTFALTS